MANLDVFRGIVRGTPESTPVFYAVPVDGGFLLEALNHRLQSARGDVRVFRSLDALYRYVADHISSPCGRTVEVRFFVAGSAQLF